MAISDKAFASVVSSVTGKKITASDVSNAAKKISGSSSSGATTKPLTYAPGSLETMTVAQATQAGRLNEYNQLVGGLVSGTGGVIPKDSKGNYVPNVTAPIDVSKLQEMNGVDLSYPPAPTPEIKTPELYNLGLQKPEDGAMTDKTIESYFEKYLGAPERTDTTQTAMETSGYLEAKSRANELSGRISALQANQRAEVAQATSQIAEEGGTTTGLSTREAAIDRKYATKLLPLTAQYQAELGNLDTAKEIMNAYIADENAYLDRYYSWQQNVGNKVWDLMTTKQKREWELQDQATARQIDEQKTLTQVKGDMFNKALEMGNSALARSIWNSQSIDEVYSKAGGLATPMSGTIGSVSPYLEERQTRATDQIDALITLASDNKGVFGKSAAVPIPLFMRSDAYRNIRAQTDSLKANIFASELAAMREASKTGGAVGNVSDTEGNRLANALGSLEMSQSPDNYIKQLQIAKDAINRWRAAVGATPLGSTPNVVTAPDGSLIQIID